MKMDNNIDSNGGDSPPHQNGTDNAARQSVSDALNEILDQFTNRLTNGVQNGSNGYSETPNRNTDWSPESTENLQFAEILQQATQIIPQIDRRATEVGSVEGIDPSSPLGRSLQRKFSELEEISRRLKTRLNQVVCDTDILLSPDGDADLNPTDVDLERDLNTDSQADDLTPQEFFQLVQSQIPSTSGESSEESKTTEEISK